MEHQPDHTQNHLPPFDDFSAVNELPQPSRLELAPPSTHIDHIIDLIGNDHSSETHGEIHDAEWSHGLNQYEVTRRRQEKRARTDYFLSVRQLTSQSEHEAYRYSIMRTSSRIAGTDRKAYDPQKDPEGIKLLHDMNVQLETFDQPLLESYTSTFTDVAFWALACQEIARSDDVQNAITEELIVNPNATHFPKAEKALKATSLELPASLIARIIQQAIHHDQ